MFKFVGSTLDEIIDLVGLNEKRHDRVKTLSGGQQRRIDLALGLIGNPEVLFRDEPTTGFDPAARRGGTAYSAATPPLRRNQYGP